MPIPAGRKYVKAYIIFAIASFILGIFGALIGDVYGAVGLLLASLFWVLISLFYLTKERIGKNMKAVLGMVGGVCVKS